MEDIVSIITSFFNYYRYTQNISLINKKIYKSKHKYIINWINVSSRPNKLLKKSDYKIIGINVHRLDLNTLNFLNSNEQIHNFIVHI